MSVQFSYFEKEERLNTNIEINRGQERNSRKRLHTANARSRNLRCSVHSCRWESELMRTLSMILLSQILESPQSSLRDLDRDTRPLGFVRKMVFVST